MYLSQSEENNSHQKTHFGTDGVKLMPWVGNMHGSVCKSQPAACIWIAEKLIMINLED